MNIHKLETHQHEIPYFMLPRETVNLITNPDSLAIWSYLQSKPKDWKLIETQLRERFGLGRKRYLDAMRHLRDLGLYEVKRYKDDDNRFTGSLFHIYHLPQVRHSTLVENDTCIKEKESLKEKESFTLEQDTPLPPMGAVEQPAPVKPKDRIPYEQIKDLFNEILPEMPTAVLINRPRESAIKARWNEHKAHQSLDFWRDLFTDIRKSDFLMGRVLSDRPFKLTFDWIIAPRNFVKIVEGNYYA